MIISMLCPNIVLIVLVRFLLRRVARLINHTPTAIIIFVFLFKAEDGIRDYKVTGVQTCALPIFAWRRRRRVPDFRRGGGRRALDVDVVLDGDRDAVQHAAIQPAGEFAIRRSSLLESRRVRSEEHTSELQSPCNLGCRLLLEKKKIIAAVIAYSVDPVTIHTACLIM